MENEKYSKLNILDKLYIILIDAFRYKSESDAQRTAKALLSFLLGIYFINILLFISTILAYDLAISQFLHWSILIISVIVVFIYYPSDEKKKLIALKLSLNDKAQQKKNYIKAIVIYLLSFCLFLINAIVKNVLLKQINSIKKFFIPLSLIFPYKIFKLF
jgi:hypothetical protein